MPKMGLPVTMAWLSTPLGLADDAVVLGVFELDLLRAGAQRGGASASSP